jgi:hypothetical protein
MTGSVVKLVHILITGPLLIYIGLMKPMTKWIYYVLGVLGIIVLLWMVFEIKKNGFNSKSIWYIIHACIFAPLLLYFAWKKWESPPQLFGVLLAIGLAAVSYHFIKLFR